MISYSVAVWLSSLGAAYTFGVSSLLPRCLSEVWERDGETLSVTSQLMYRRVQDWPSKERNGTGLVSSRDGQFGQENVQERSGAGRVPGMLLVLN